MRPNLSTSKLFKTLMLGVGTVTAFSVSAAEWAPLPPERSVGNVSYVSGGVGSDEAQAMKEAAPRYPLGMTFVARDHEHPGAYNVADKVVVRDAAGQVVLDAEAEGPMLLAKLPPGKYRVEAVDDNGRARERTVMVKPGKHAHLVFEW